ENVIIGRLIPARVETPGMQDIINQPTPEQLEQFLESGLPDPQGSDLMEELSDQISDAIWESVPVEAVSDEAR
ncbi:MAG: hypothetical protein VX643_01480, partial [Chloroflexota bacterium]|nr:hypothetical protein [Chloroflexota bacterium]